MNRDGDNTAKSRMPRRNALVALRHFPELQGFRARDRLPPERELAQTLGVTRPQLRTVMKQLENEGLVWRHVGRGTFFGSRSHEGGDQLAMSPAAATANPRELMEALRTINARAEDFSD